MATNKKIAKTIAKAGAMNAKKTQQNVAYAQKQTQTQKNIKSAQGNTSNAFSKEDTRRKNISAAIKDAYNPNSNSYIAQAKRRAEAKYDAINKDIINGVAKKSSAPKLSPKQQAERRTQGAIKQAQDRAKYGTGLPDARTQAALNQTRDRAKYGEGFKPIPSLEEYKSPAVFNGASKHLDNGKGFKENSRNALDALSAGYTSFNERINGSKTLAKLTEALTGSKEVADSFLNTWRQVKSGLDYDSMPMYGGPINQDIDKLYEEHPTAEKVGDYTAKIAQYNIASQLLPFIPGVGAAQANIASKFGGGMLGDYIANTALDIIPDLALDVTPNAINNVASGMSGKDVAKNVAKDVAINEVFNAVANALPFVSEIPALKREANDASYLDALLEGIGESGYSGKAVKGKLGNPYYSNQKLPDVIQEADILKKLNDYDNGLKINPIEDNLPKHVDWTTKYDNWEPGAPESIVKEIEPESLAKEADNVVKEASPEDLAKQAEIEDFVNGAKQADTAVPKNERLVPERGEVKPSSYASTTVPTKTKLAEEAPDLVKEFEDNPVIHRALLNADVEAAADEIASKPFVEAFNDYTQLLANKDPVSIPLGYNLARQAALAKQTDLAVSIVENMSRELTKAGQFTQAAAIKMLKDDPGAAMKYLQKQVDNLNEICAKKFGKKFAGIDLTAEEKEALLSIAPGDEKAIADEMEKISKRIVKELPVTKWEKAVELRRMAMLLNPKTHIKNPGANLAVKPLASASDRIEALYQRIWKATGDKDFNITQSLKGGSPKLKKQIADTQIFETKWLPKLGETNLNEWKDMVDSNEWLRQRQIFNDSKLGAKAKELVIKTADGAKKFKISDTLDRITDGKVKEVLDSLGEEGVLTDSILENLRNFDYYLLGAVEDDPFVKSRFINRLASYLDAQGIKELPQDLSSLPKETLEMIEDAEQVAWDEALKATFKDNNSIVRMFSGLKKSMGKAGEVLFPFVKTPANIAARMIDYSPAGLVKAFSEAIKNEGADKVINSLAKGTTGTFMTLMGYMLAKEGIITGELSENKNKAAFQKQQGKLPYSINIGGKNFTFDWLQPAGAPLVIGASIYDAINESDRTWVDAGINGAIAATDAWSELSPLQNFGKLFKSDYNGDVSFGNNVKEIAKDFPLSFIPSLMGATARATDNAYRETYDKAGGDSRYYLNQIMAKIPGLSKMLPMQSDTWGNPRQRAESDAENALQQYIFPWTSGYDASTPIDSEIESLYDSTSSNAVFPHKTSWSYDYTDRKGNKQKYNLSNEEHAEMQEEMGQDSYNLAEDFITSPEYANLSDDAKVAILGKLYGIAENSAKQNLIMGYEMDHPEYATMIKTAAGRKEIIDNLIRAEKYSEAGVSSSKFLDEAYEQGPEAFAEAVAQKKTLEEYGLNATEKNIELLESQGEEGLQNKVTIDSLIKDYGITSSNAKAYALDVGAEEAQKTFEDISSFGLTPNTQSLGIYEKSGTQYLPVLKKADAAGDDNGTLKKAELVSYLQSQGYSIAEANRIIELFGWKKIKKY